MNKIYKCRKQNLNENQYRKFHISIHIHAFQIELEILSGL